MKKFLLLIVIAAAVIAAILLLSQGRAPLADDSTAMINQALQSIDLNDLGADFQSIDADAQAL